MRIAVAWPKPRQSSWRQGRTDPDRSPDQSDALLCLEEEGFTVALEDTVGFPFNPLARHHHFYSGIDPARALRIVSRLRRYDAVVCVGDSLALVLLWLRETFGFRCPIILLDPGLGGGYARRKRVQDYLLPKVDHIVVYGQVQLDYLRQEYGPGIKATFLRHRIDVDFYRPDVAPPRPARPFIFSIGNDISRDYATLSEAAAICGRQPGFNYEVLVHTVLPVEAADGMRVERASIPYDRLRELYAQATVVVVPLSESRHAGGINALLEAMAMGKPVVVSRSAGLADYVEHESTALIVPPHDAAALAAAIDRLLRSPADAERLGAAARQFVVDQCANRIYARALAKVIRAAVGRK